MIGNLSSSVDYGAYWQGGLHVERALCVSKVSFMFVLAVQLHVVPCNHGLW